MNYVNIQYIIAYLPYNDQQNLTGITGSATLISRVTAISVLEIEYNEDSYLCFVHLAIRFDQPIMDHARNATRPPHSWEDRTAAVSRNHPGIIGEGQWPLHPAANGIITSLPTLLKRTITRSGRKSWRHRLFRGTASLARLCRFRIQEDTSQSLIQWGQVPQFLPSNRAVR